MKLQHTDQQNRKIINEQSQKAVRITSPDHPPCLSDQEIKRRQIKDLELCETCEGIQQEIKNQQILFCIYKWKKETRITGKVPYNACM